MRIRVPPATAGDTIGVREAARKYAIPHKTISQWASKGEVQVFQTPLRKGDLRLLDELSLQARIKQYTPHRDSAKRRIRATATPAAPPPSHPRRPLDSPEQAPAPARLAASGSPARIAVRPSFSRLTTQALVEAFYADCKSRNLDSKTLSNYKWALGPFAEAYPHPPKDRVVIIGYVQGLPLGAGAQHSVYRRLKYFYGWLSREHKFERVDLDHPSLPKNIGNPGFWDWQQIARILHACKTTMEECIVVGLTQTGARREEFCGITAANFEGHWARVPSKVTKANGTGARFIYFPKETQLRLTLALGGRDRLYVGNWPLSVDKIDDVVRELLKRAGLYRRGVNCHAFRHSYSAEYQYNHGRDLFLDTLMGHFKRSMSQHYLHLPNEELYLEADRAAPRRFLQGAMDLALPQEVAV